MRTALLGLLGLVSGGAVVASGILDRSPSPDTATAIGELLALGVGALLLAVGARAMLRS